MENQKNRTGYYSALVWLLLTEYEKDKGYTPSKYLLDSLGPKIEAGSSGLDLQICDAALFDFTIASGVNDFFNLFFDTTRKFENGLIILSYNKEKYIVRDFYLANIAKQYSCWDTVYLNCDVPHKVTSKVFDYILTPSDLPDGLTKIIERKNA